MTMTRTFTRTHTRYFDHDDIAKLLDIAKRMQADFHSRSEFIDTEVIEAGSRRLAALFSAIGLADEVIVP